jgi:hypothetical protein
MYTSGEEGIGNGDGELMKFGSKRRKGKYFFLKK